VLVIQEFALEQQDRLLELDVNPLIVRPRGRGVVAVDALIRLAGERSHA
jgi:acetate---CoA ligase (ADP-forming)